MTSLSCSPLAHAPIAQQNKGLRSFSVAGLVALWRSRRALAALSADQLADIGVSRDAAHKEAQRPVWDVPAHWRN